VKYLIDTHTLIWIVTNNSKLSDKARSLYLDSDNDIYFSMASIWEMAIKISIKKMSIQTSLINFINDDIVGNNIKILNINIPHICYLEKLPFHHRDPFDRLILSQGITESIPVISSDKKFDLYPVNRIW